MTLEQAIQRHVANFSPEKQAEVLDFVLFLERKREQADQEEKNRVTPPRSVGGSLRAFTDGYIPLPEAREQARREFFHELAPRHPQVSRRPPTSPGPRSTAMNLSG